MSDMILPEVTFSTFVMSLGSSALVHLGEVAEPESGTINKDLALAKHTIDILSMLEEKSAGNLDADEKTLLEGLLYDLRLKYVMHSK